MSLRRRLVNTNNVPLRESSLSLSPTRACNVFTPARMSHGSSAMKILRLPAKLSMARIGQEL